MWRSQEHSPSGDQDQRTVHKKIKSGAEYAPRGNSEKCNHDGKRVKDVKYVAKKVRRVTSIIPLVIRSSQAFEVGVEGCETCSLNRDGYKKVMQSIKIIEILVDGVIEKEQTELLDNKETVCDDGYGEGDRSSLRKNSSFDEQPSNEKDVNRQKDAIDHNLKCILIMLQKCIGDTIVQICYVKSKNLSSDKNYKHFNVPISDLKLLKFEFTNLTHLIIQLFKKNVKGSKVDEDICVLCVKEKLLDCEVRLLDELKSGRNLKVVMKNGKARENEHPCCSRDYPHVHAEADGNPIVLKYSLPFQVNKPPGKDFKPDKAKTKQSTNQNETGITNVPDKKNSPKNVEPNIQENKTPEDTSRPIDSSTTGNTNGEQNSKIPTNKITKPIPYDQWPDEDGDDPEVKPAEKIENDHSIPLEDSGQIDGETDVPVDSSNTSNISETQPQVRDTNTVKSPPSLKNLSQTEPDETDEKGNDELYCGCNFDKVFEKLNIKLPSVTDRDPKSSVSGTSDSFTMVSSGSDVGKRRRTNKKVSFFDDYQNQTVYPFQVNEPNTVFDVVPETISDSNEKGEDFTNRTPFGETAKEAPVYLTAVDSIILTKQRLSSCEHEHVEVKDFLEDKAVACAFKPFIPKSEYVVHVTTQDPPNIKDIQPIPRRPVSKKSKIVEDILKDIDKNTIFALHSNPECCEEYSLKEYGSTSNLPITSSINSLPLDHNDLNSISAVLGKDISQAEIMLLSEEDTTDQMCVWETQYDDQSTEENRTKWLRAFAGTENPSHHLFATLPEVRREHSSLRRSSVKGYRTREVHQTLPTIAEEVAFVVDDEDFHMPYVPSISSLPLNEVELNELLRQKRPSAKHKTMELRYFTVEFPQVDTSKKNISEENQIIPKISSSSGENQIPSSNESFHSCCSSTSDLCTNIISADCLRKDLKALSLNKKTNSTLKAVDEMIMLNAIFLSDESFEDNKPRNLRKTSSEDMYNWTTDNYVRIHPGNDFESTDSVKQYNTRRLSYTIIKDDSSQFCVSRKDKDVPIVAKTNVQKYKIVNDGINKFTQCEGNIHECSIENLNKSNHKNSIVSPIHHAKNKSYTILRNSVEPSVDYNIPNIDNYQYIYLKDSVHSTNTNSHKFNKKCKQDFLIADSATPSSLNSYPRNNKSYTIINKIENINLPHILSPVDRTNKDLRKSYTIVKDTVDPKQNSVGKATHVDLIYKLNNNQDKLSQNNGRMTENDTIREPDAVEWCREQLTKVLTEHSKYIKKSLQKENSSTVKLNRNSNDKMSSNKNSVLCLISEDKSEQHIQPNISRSSVSRMPLTDNEGIEKRVTPPQSIISKLRELLETDKGTSLSSIKKLEPSKMAEGDISIKYDDLESLLKNSLEFEDVGSVSNKKDFGFDKQYISVKNYSPLNKTDTCKIKFELTLDEQSNGNDRKENNITKPIFSQNINFPTDVKNIGSNILTGYDAITNVTPSVEAKCSNYSFMNDRPSGDHTSKAWYLYDASGLPLTDNSGRLLRKSNGDLLVVCDAAGIPVSDADRNQIYDLYGRSPGNSQFNPSKPLSMDILKTLTTAAGNPIAVYDVKGRPLTSVSGTMLFDCTGRGLIRYGSHGNPISDLSGKPLFDANGRQITD